MADLVVWEEVFMIETSNFASEELVDQYEGGGGD
jgi:hypothetical protein